MANGHFLGGVVKGMESFEADERAQAALGLQERGLGLQQQQIEQTGRLGERRLGLEERALGLQEKNARFVQGRAVQAEADAAIAETMKLAAQTITAGLSAGRDPEQIRKAVTPLLADAQGLAARIGKDPKALARQLDTMLTLPGAEEAAAAEGKATAAKQKAMAEGGVSLLKPEQKVAIENSLRDDFTKQSAPFIETRDAFSRIQAIQPDDKTGAGDVALLYSYMKMLDPRSTVREGEIAQARDAAGVPGTVLNLYNSVVKGQALTPDLRQAFLTQAKSQFEKQNQQHQRRVKTFGAIAKRQGADPQNVVIDLSPPEETQSPSGGADMLGYKVRQTLFPGEDEFFRKNPTVAGMAAETGDVILNPYSGNNINKNAVAKNEAFRLFLRDNKITPSFDLTPEQRTAFRGTPYGGDEKSLKETIAARIYSGDPSAKATPEQKQWVQSIMGKSRTPEPPPGFKLVN